ncbi:Sorbose reductase SOU1 [Vanrija pseudolonga]|uniref:Sorbose reductase SOU1 n=1 Tax=Vanrija pseudolonga TaxID=143232 RepID=A0AAF0Y9N9_9TREE|nr:Sorbose reductase SOU1 [Vanrija pseudolonga]
MPITLDYSSKLILITGGGRGIGYAIARALASAGATLALTYTSKDCSEVAAALEHEFGITVKTFKAEASDSADTDRLVADVEAAFGKKVDIAIANAGVALWKDAHAMTDDDFKRLFEVNTYGPYYLSRALVRSWLDLPIGVDPSAAQPDIKSITRKLGKQILIVSSISGLVAMSPQRQAAYNASKAAVTMLSKSLAEEWAHLGVTVNTISPGYVATDMVSSGDPKLAEWSKEWTYRTPVGKFASAADLGQFVALLVSDQQGGWGFFTGSDVVVDGGYTTL